MPKKFPLKAAALLLAGILVGFAGQEVRIHSTAGQVKAGYTPTCLINGDVFVPFSLKGADSHVAVEFDYKGECLEGIPLADIVERAQPVTDSYDVLLIGDDGLSAILPGEDLSGSHIVLSPQYGWEAINLYHPISSNIKRLEEIVIITKEANPDYGLNIITADANLRLLTPGSLYKEMMPIIPYFEGTSTVDHDGRTFSTSILSRRRLFALADLVAGHDAKNLLAMGSKGEYAYINAEGYIELKNNSFNYVTMERDGGMDDLKGIIVNPPIHSITDLYHDTLHYLKGDEKVLILFLDGFGYHQYLAAAAEGFAPFIAALPAAQRALSVYQPVTNAGFAAMITGTTPEENGVYSRDQMDLNVPSLFGAAQKLGKKSVLIEGHIKILNTEIEPILHIDTNKNGSTDDEIFASALQCIDQAYDVVMVHFHSIDDAGHTNGDLHPKTMEQIKVIDGYVKELTSGWDGKVIILADHGMHSTEDAGNHGVFRYEDLIVPYITAQGGQGQ